MAYDWISKTLYFVDGSKKTIELVRVDVNREGRMRKTIMDEGVLTKPRGIGKFNFYSKFHHKMSLTQNSAKVFLF